MKWPWMLRKWRLLGQWVQVKLVPDLGSDPDGSKILGACNAAKNRIQILEGLSEDAALEIFWHEKFHLLEDAGGFGWEERDVKVLARMFSSMWMDNAENMLTMARWVKGRGK